MWTVVMVEVMKEKSTDAIVNQSSGRSANDGKLGKLLGKLLTKYCLTEGETNSGKHKTESATL